MADLSVEFLGLKLRSPIMAASAGITGNAERLKRAQDHGVGSVIMKTAFQEPLMANSPTPRFAIIQRKAGTNRSTTLYSYEQGYEYGIEAYCEEIRKAKRSLEIPIIASIGGLDDETWVKWGRMVEEAGADALELNLSCPHGAIVLHQTNHIAEVIDHNVRLMKRTLGIPIIAKMTPQMSDPAVVARLAQEAGADAVTMFSRFPGLDIDVNTEEAVLHGGTAGHGGPWAIHYALYWINLVHPGLSIPISGCGGVLNGEDVVKYVLAGSTTIQTAMAIIMQGYEVIDRLNRELGEWMDRHGYATLGDFRGAVNRKVKTMAQVAREKTVRARIDEAKCNGCGLCERVCIYFAIGHDGKTYRVGEKCDGCGLCPQLCPQNCIAMVPRG
ncbi:MAG TPA: 4Fe-4S binding protein [Bacillota bacterium]